MRLWMAVLLAGAFGVSSFANAQAEVRKPMRAINKKEISKRAPSKIPALSPILTTYDVYVGGFHLVAANIWFEQVASTYRVVVRARTRGIWGHFFPWNTLLDAHGNINGDRLEPNFFFTRDEWNKKPKITKLTFDGKGDVLPEFEPPNTDKNREIVTPEQRKGALDPITALLQMVAHVAVNDSCEIPVPVFDGKRRFDITGRDAGRGKTFTDGYGVYDGDARLCAAYFKMISGEWKDREQSRFWQKTETEPGREPFKIWLASPAEGLPELPVRLESDSVVGAVIVHLSAWRYATLEEIQGQKASLPTTGQRTEE